MAIRDRADLDFAIHIPFAFAFLLLHRDTASPQPCQHPIQFDIQPLNPVLLGLRGSRAGGACLHGLVPQHTHLLIFLLLQGFAQRLQQVEGLAR